MSEFSDSPLPPAQGFFKSVPGKVLAAVLAIAIVAIGYVIFEKQANSRRGDFSLNQKVTAQSMLHFEFPETMDKKSVEENLSIPGELSGYLHWEGQVLTFDPTEKLEEGRVYTFTLNAQAKRADGAPLGRDLTFQFDVSGMPELVTQMPAKDAKDIPQDAKITLVFDRPMIPLTQVQGSAAGERMPNWPVTISPKVNGRWRWLATTAVEFIPSDRLVPATAYTVTVPAGLETVSGDKTDRDFSWSFETLRPQIVSTNPAENSKSAGPTTEIVLHFNQEMDLTKAKGMITLLEQDTTSFEKSRQPKRSERREERLKELGTGSVVAQAGEQTIAVRSLKFGTVEVDGKNETDRTAIVVVPDQPLKFKKTYTIRIAPGLKAARGELGTPSFSTTGFHTVSDLKVNSARSEYGSVYISFSQPTDDATLNQGIVFDPPVEGWADLELYTSPGCYEGELGGCSKNDLYVWPTLKPSTKYTVTVTKAVKDIFGQALAEPYVFSFKTDPLPPQLFIHSKGEFGIFEKDKAPIYYLNNINVKRMDLEFAKLTLPEFLSLRSARVTSYNSAPVSLTGKDQYQKWSISSKAAPDTWEVVQLDIEKKLGHKLSPGIYALTLTGPEYKNQYGGATASEVQFFALTDMAMTLKYSGNRALVWVVNMQTGEPVKNAAIGIHSLEGKLVQSGRTDDAGFFEAAVESKTLTLPGTYNPEFYVTAEKDGDFAFVGSQWNDGVRPGDFGIYEEFQHMDAPKYRVDSYLYSDRPVYRTGDTVNFKGIVRLRDWDGKIQVPTKEMNARVTITDSAEGKEVYVKTLPISAFGSFHGDFVVAPEAALGNYNIALQLLPEADVGQMYNGHTFSVLEYRKPEYRVEVTTEQDDYFDDDTVQATVAGSYYFGAPMADSKVVWRAQTTDYFFNKYTEGWYSFALEDVWCYYDCSPQTQQIAEGEGKLDAAGQLNVSVPVNIDDKGVSQVLSIEADVFDQNNQVVANRVSVPVHKSQVYVGVRSEDYIVTPGEKAKIGVVAVDPEGNLLKNQSVKLELFSRTWNTIRTKSVDGQYYYESEPKDTFLSDTTVTTGSDGKAIGEVKIPTGGQFRIVATAKDGKGRVSKAGTSVYAWSNTYFNWPHSNSDRLDMEADKPEYKVGDTAKLLIKSPYQGKGVKALVTVERENVIRKEVIDIVSNAQPIEVKITEDLIPNAFVSVVIIKPRVGETFNDNGLDTGAPGFKVGLIQLKVETSKKKVDLTLQTDKERYGPGETVTVKLKATDAEGKPVSSELSLSVIDMSVLALTGFQLPDLVSYFYAERGLGVNTSAMLMHLIERFKPGSKGGGGSDPELKKRGNFKDTAYWNPVIETNEQGWATVSFVLPDNLTTWQLLALGSTKEHTYGSIAEEIIETKNVIVRPVRPRFAVHGDAIDLGAIVHNFLPTPQKFTVTLTGSGFTALGKMTQEVTLKMDEQKKLIFPVRMNRVDRATLTFKAVSPDGRDEIEEKIPVYAFGTPQSVATSGITESNAEEKVLVPTEKDASQGKLKITVSPTLASYLPSGLEYLVQFPYGCAEQTVSSFLPNVVVKGLEGFDAFEIVDDQTLDKNISGGLQKIYNFQRADGGFGFWEGSPQSYPYLSAYMLFALQHTQNAGYPVDATVISKARSYLQGVLRKHNLDRSLDLTERAYILYVLSENESSLDPALLENIWPKRASLPVFAQAQLAMAFQNAGKEDRAKTLLTEILNAAKVDGRGTHFEEVHRNIYDVFMNTNTRTTAFVLQALNRIDSKNPLIPKIVRFLLVMREQGHWDTTQSTVISLLAFTEYLRTTKELDAAYKTTVTVEDKNVLTGSFDKETILTKKDVTLALSELLRSKENTVKIEKTGNGRLYYDILLSYFYEADTLPPAEEGIGILREMEPVVKGTKDVLLGSTQRVKLTITVPEDRHFVAVESPLPAGMEPIDLGLLTSQQNLLEGEVNEDAKNIWGYSWYWNPHWWTHEELRDDRIFLFADHLPAGVYEYEYLIRATTPGKFRLRPARVWEMYFPETFGQTAGQWFEVKE